tara:strand:+ start:115 stop:273 length:159 start_codon:yes stop_codon:yes gene_type:complete
MALNKQVKQDRLSVRLSKDLKNDMEVVKSRYGTSLSSQVNLALKDFHNKISS